METSKAGVDQAPISVLFVCLGNICRSPLAEATFKSITAGNPKIGDVDSAGTGAYHTGDSPDPRTLDTLRDNGINDFEHDARKVQAVDFTDFDYILAMDSDNLAYLQRMKQRVSARASGKGKVMLFGDFGGRKHEEVIDPYYGSNNGFTIAYEQMVRFSKGFVKEVL
ncbi:hypothetical protein MMC09_006821 [Bachmanniomyces sp. S44760]|nr:hypothetical protein [Bachmanniomyces sp. S44760]